MSRAQVDKIVPLTGETHIPIVYPTLAAAVADDELVVGMWVKIEGRPALYKVVAAATGTPDGGSYIDLTGISGQIEAQFEENYWVEQWGPSTTPGTDTSTEFGNACTFIAAQGGGLLRMKSRDFYFSSTVTVPTGVYLEGDHDTRFIPNAGFTGTFMFLFNTDASESGGFTESFPGQLSGGMSKARFDNSVNDVAGMKAIQFAGSHNFSQLRFVEFDQAIVKDSGAYSDQYSISDCHFLSLDAQTDWQVDIPGQGDAVLIERLHFSKGSRTLPQPGINITLAQDGVISKIIGGKHNISNCQALNVDIYTEFGNVTVNSSSITLSLHQYCIISDNPIVLTNTVGGNHRVVLKDCIFNYGLNKSPVDVPEVKINSGYEVEIDNCVRRLTTNGVNDPQQSGIRVEDATDTLVADFNDFSYMNSRRSTIKKDNRVLTAENDYEVGAGSFTGISAAAVGTEGVWDAAQTTYYYRAQLLCDPVRDIGRNGGAEVSVAVGAANKAVELTLAFGGPKQVGVVRVYRGTATGSYDNYVDIHLMSVSKFYDIGSTLNGITWTSRAASGMDSIQITPLHFRKLGNMIEVWSSVDNHPSTGTWVAGDKIYFPNEAVDGNNMLKSHRVCVTSGTPSAPNTHPRQYISTVSPAT